MLEEHLQLRDASICVNDDRKVFYNFFQFGVGSIPCGKASAGTISDEELVLADVLYQWTKTFCWRRGGGTFSGSCLLGVACERHFLDVNFLSFQHVKKGCNLSTPKSHSRTEVIKRLRLAGRAHDSSAGAWKERVGEGDHQLGFWGSGQGHFWDGCSNEFDVVTVY